MIAGDAIHNTRSALDHAVWALATTAGREPDERLQFPVFTHEPRPDRLREQLAGLADGHIDVIQQIQPYRDPESERSRMLIDLVNLDNHDKHRLVPTLYVLSSEATIGREPPYETGPEGLWFSFNAPVTPRTVILRWKAEDREQRPSEYDFGFRIGFGSPSTGTHELEQMRLAVTQIVEALENT